MRMRVSSPGDGRYVRLVGKVEHITEVPMFLLSLVYALAFSVGYLAEPDSGLLQNVPLVEGVIVALFAAKLAVKVAAVRTGGPTCGRIGYKLPSCC